ncbi:ZIP family metal transporter [Isosphaeraceae bacterium EP7]
MVARLALFSVSVVVASLFGGCFPLAASLTHTRLQVYLSFAAGTMLGAVFFHMLPEAIELAGGGDQNALAWTAAGLLSLFFLERFFAFHHHEAPADPHEPCPTHLHEHGDGRGHAAGLVDEAAPGGIGPGTKGVSLHWGAAAIGLTAHTIAGGIALASAVAADNALGDTRLGMTSWGVFLATVLHKPADALTIVSLMLRAGVPRNVVHTVNLGFSLMIPLGVLLFFAGIGLTGPGKSDALTANALAFSAGTFLCIALSDLLPELQFHAHDRLKLSAALLAGVGLMALASGWE